MNRPNETAISLQEKNVDDLLQCDNKVPLTEGINKHPVTD